jgi:hypothetical protein
MPICLTRRADAAAGKQGGALVDALHEHTRHGGRSVLVANIVQRACEPLLEMVRLFLSSFPSLV